MTGLALGSALAGIILWGLKLLYNWRAESVGRIKARNEQLEADKATAKRSAEIDSEVRRLGDGTVADELRDKWSRD